MSDLAVTGLFALALLGIVGLGEGLRSLAGWRAEDSRRVVHAFTGLAVVVAIPFFDHPLGLYVLAGGFVGINLLSIARGWFPGMHGIRRRSIGTVTFPLALIFALVACWTLDPARTYIIQIAFLVLAISDPLASWLGTRVRRPGRYAVGRHEKSLAGSAIFFLSALALIAGGLAVFRPGEPVMEAVLIGLSVALLATAAEALFGEGWDNFFVVVAVVAPLAWLHQFPDALPALLLAASVGLGFGIVAHALRFLTLDGAIAASGLAFFVVAFGGWAWVAPAFVFFFLSSALSKIGSARKGPAEALAEKGSTRDAGQVFSNGGVAWLILLIFVFFPEAGILYWGFVGAFAAAAADTWATEVGTMVRGQTRLLWGWQSVPPGTSGGVSVAGSMASLGGAAAVFFSMTPFVDFPLAGGGLLLAAIAVIGGAILASAVDSVLGATAQAVYRDPVTGDLTERSAGRPARGWAWMTNDRVNQIGTVVGAAVPMLILSLTGG